MKQGEKYTSKLGYYPVIYITLKDIQGKSFENILKVTTSLNKQKSS